jgi:uncharacterized protein (DUF952 family)
VVARVRGPAAALQIAQQDEAMSDLIFKILSSSAWTDAQAAGVFVGSEVDLADGFIHFSTAEQVVETARKHFAGQRDLVLVAVAASALGEKLRFEPSRGGALFPHLYAPLAVELAQWAKPLPIGPDGRFAFPDLA